MSPKLHKHNPTEKKHIQLSCFLSLSLSFSLSLSLSFSLSIFLRPAPALHPALMFFCQSAGCCASPPPLPCHGLTTDDSQPQRFTGPLFPSISLTSLTHTFTPPPP